MTLNKDKITGVVKVSGTLDIDGANSLREALLDCLHQQGEVEADLSEADRCDATVLQVLLACRRDTTAAGKTFRITAASSAVTETAAALGLSIDTAGEGLEHYHSNAN